MAITLPDNATPVGATGNKFAAFVSRYGDCAMVYIFPRSAGYGIDFRNCLAAYETASAGASASARREIAKLEREVA